MDDKIGIWIDHRKAVIVSVSDGQVIAKTVKSDVPRHTRYSHRAVRSANGSQQDGGGEKKYENRYGEQLHRYYEQVVHQLGERPRSLVIFGPGEAKLQLRERLRSSKFISEAMTELEISDKLTDAQIVAKVKEHYGISLKRPRAIAKSGKSSGMGKTS